MPSEVTNYQCPSCTAPLHFSEQSGQLECDYCGSTFSVEDVQTMYEAKNEQAEESFSEPTQEAPWAMDEAGSPWGEEADGMRSLSCPSCGAELLCDATTAATACPYCGNPAIVPGQFADARKPDLIIPFAVSREQAVEALKRHYRRKPLLPRAFSRENQIQKIQGVYVPFWLFDAEVEADMRFHATRVTTRTTSDETITRTDHFLVHRRGRMRFQNVPVDGSSKMPDGHMDAIEPFDYSGLRPFALAYLPGFLADRYDVSQDECAQRANRRCVSTTEQALQGTVLGYQTCVATSRSASIRPGQVRYALLPVWMLSTHWRGKHFLFAMNGQTGKLIGDLPVDWARLAACCAGVFAAVTALTALIFG